MNHTTTVVVPGISVLITREHGFSSSFKHHPDSPKMRPYLASHYVVHQSLDSEIQKTFGARYQQFATSDLY